MKDFNLYGESKSLETNLLTALQLHISVKILLRYFQDVTRRNLNENPTDVRRMKGGLSLSID